MELFRSEIDYYVRTKKYIVHAQDSCSCTRFRWAGPRPWTAAFLGPRPGPWPLQCMHKSVVHAQCTRILCMHKNLDKQDVPRRTKTYQDVPRRTRRTKTYQDVIVQFFRPSISYLNLFPNCSKSRRLREPLTTLNKFPYTHFSANGVMGI